MTHEPAPTRRRNEPPLDYVLRVADYLSEPDRRRLKVGTAYEVRLAVEQARRGRVPADEQRPHLLLPTWHSHGGELTWQATIACPYHPANYEKPCRVWADEDGESGECEPGCYARDLLDAVGIQDMMIHVPDGFSGTTIPLYCVGGGDSFELRHPDLTYQSPHIGVPHDH